MADQGNQEKKQENKEENLRDAGRRDRDSCEPKASRDQRDDQKPDGPAQHFFTPFSASPQP
jgi:hypothetical protein